MFRSGVVISLLGCRRTDGLRMEIPEFDNIDGFPRELIMGNVLHPVDSSTSDVGRPWRSMATAGNVIRSYVTNTHLCSV